MGLFPDKLRPQADYLQSNGYVFGYCFFGKQLKILEHKADLPAQEIKFWPADPIQVDSIYKDVTTGGLGALVGWRH